MYGVDVAWDVAGFLEMDGQTDGQTSILEERKPPLVLILCGHCGVGKSSAANLLTAQQHFVTQRSAAAVTSECRAETTECGGREVHVIDTPGLSDPEVTNPQVHVEIIRGVAEAAAELPGAEFAVLLVMSLASRVDDGVIEAFKALKRAVFGAGMWGQSCVLWTHGDLLMPPPSCQLVAPDAAPALLSFCGACGHKSGATRFCTACGAHLGAPVETSVTAPAAAPPPAPAPAALPPSTTAPPPPPTDAALDSYLAGAGSEVQRFLSLVRGTHVVLSNPEHIFEQACLERTHLVREVESAAAVAGPASNLAPPKRRGKLARRERQLALAQQGLVGRAVPVQPEKVDGAGEDVPGLVGLLYRWWAGGTAAGAASRSPLGLESNKRKD